MYVLEIFICSKKGCVFIIISSNCYASLKQLIPATTVFRFCHNNNQEREI